jgi:Dyp-type peroxidase family
MLDMSDIQGNILRGYRSFHFARFMYFEVTDPKDGRLFVANVLEHVTPAEWGQRPTGAINIGFSFAGLCALGLQCECLTSFPSEFQEGMKARASSLGDTGDAGPKHWDKTWCTGRVHVLVMCYGATAPALDQQCQRVTYQLPSGVREVNPHQDAGLLQIDGRPSRKEHFGFEDGITNPPVEDVRDDGPPGDTGNPDANGVFGKVPVGEFLLGHRSEGGEVPPMPAPNLFAFNGSFLVFRKLEQNVPRFRQFLRDKGPKLANSLAHPLPAGVSPEDYLAAKMLGRWTDGSSLDLYPEKPANDRSNKFNYGGDPEGARCPMGAHTRRVNGRASLGFDGNILRRRRLIRRGIAYGEYLRPEDEVNREKADAPRGLMFLAFNASIRRQFEFVQQQWINYGDEFSQGDDTDPIAGARYGDGRMAVPGTRVDRTQQTTGRMMIQGDERTGRSPFLCAGMPRFVTTKGGDYFFVPSRIGLRLLSLGQVVVP